MRHGFLTQKLFLWVFVCFAAGLCSPSFSHAQGVVANPIGKNKGTSSPPPPPSRDTVKRATVRVVQFNDVDGDGIQNGAEVGVHPDIEVFLYNSARTSVYNRFPDSEGVIEFTNIELLDGNDDGFPYTLELNPFSFPFNHMVTTGETPTNLNLKDGEVQTHYYGIGPDFGGNKPMRLLFIGDSITYGIGDPQADFDCVATPEWGFPRYLAEMLSMDFQNVEVVNRGKCGYRSDEILPGAINSIRREKSGYVIIMMGANDLIHGSTVDSIVPDYARLIQETVARNMVPVIVSTTPYRQSGEIAQKLWQLSASTDTIMADVEGDLAAKSGLMEDRVHPNLDGHIEIARVIYQAILYRITGNNPSPPALNQNESGEPETETSVTQRTDY